MSSPVVREPGSLMGCRARPWRREYWSISTPTGSRRLLAVLPGDVEDRALFVGDDWAEDHHDVEVQDRQGRAVKRARLAEGTTGMARFHELVAALLPEDAEPAEVLVCIETDRGP